MKAINNYLLEKLVINKNTKLHYTYDNICKILEPISTKEWTFNEVTWDTFDRFQDEFSWNTSDEFVDKIYDIHDKLKNDNIYVIEYFTSDDPPMSMVFFDKNPFKYIIFYDNKFTDLIESNTPKDVKDELCNIIK